MKAKSVKSLKLKRKSTTPAKQDDNFWPLFTSELLSSTSWNSSELAKGFNNKKGKTTKTSSEIRYREKLISLPSCIDELLSMHELPTDFVDGVNIKDITLFSSTFDLHTFYIQNKRLCEQTSIFTRTINAFDILWTNPLWQKSDFISYGFFEWAPHNHIYSNNKTNLSLPHDPDVNSYGKYLIRVFHANEWRAITVDDQIPVDFDKNILLPFYYDNDKLHLWPILLTKAFLKLNQAKIDYVADDVDDDENSQKLQSKTKKGKVCECKKDDLLHANICHKNYFVDLDPITAFTGWYGTEYDLDGRQNSEKWNTILGIYEQMKNNELVVLSIDVGQNNQFFVQMLDVRYYPFVEPEPIDTWKTHRWKNWAIDQGLYKCESQCNGILVSVSAFIESKIIEFIDKDKYVGEKATITLENGIPEGDLGSKLSVKSKKLSSRKPIIMNQNTSKHWLRFDKVAKYIKNVKIYHKPDTYANNFKLSSEEMSPSPENYLNFKANSTSDLFLFSENPQDEYLHVTLNNMRINNNQEARRCCSLIIIPYHWHHNNINISNDLLTPRLVAYQSATDTILLPKGRHVYLVKLLVDHYSALFQSNCDFKLVGESEVWALLQQEPLSMQNYVDELCEVFYNLVQSIGKGEFNQNLQELYKVIHKLFIPEWTNNKYARSFIWELFISEFIKLLKNDQTDVRLIKSLFMFPNFTRPKDVMYAHHKKVAREMCGVYRELRHQKCPCNDENLKIFDKSYVEQVEDYAASVIGSWFKQIYVRNMKSCHNKSEFLADMTNFYEKYFENDKSMLFELVRSITCNQRQIHCVKELSVFYNDMKNSLTTITYNGIVPDFDSNDCMSFACSISLTCHSLTPELYSIRFTLTSSDQLSQNDINDLNIIPFIKIIDEDNNYPIAYGSSHNIKSNTCLLMRNHNGYTLYAYFWSKKQQKQQQQTHSSQSSMSWNIEISFQKHVAPLHACESIPIEKNDDEDKNKRSRGNEEQKLPACNLITANEMNCVAFSGNYKKYFDKKLCRFYGLFTSKEANKTLSISLFFKCSLQKIPVKMRISTNNNDTLCDKQLVNGELIDIGRKITKNNCDSSEFNSQSSNNKIDSFLGNDSIESFETINETKSKVNLTTTFDFVIEFSFENENELRYDDNFYWDLRIFYPMVRSNDLTIEYDNERNLKDQVLRDGWKENGLLERGKILREFLVKNNDIHFQTPQLSSHSFGFGINSLNFDIFHERLEGYL